MARAMARARAGTRSRMRRLMDHLLTGPSAGPRPAWGRTAGPGTLARLFRAVKPGWLRSIPHLLSARAREPLENGKDSRARIAPSAPQDEGGTMSGRVPLLALGT